MKKALYLITCLLLSSPLYSSSDECVYMDPIWQKKQPKTQQNLLRNPSFKEMDKQCFIAFLNRLSQSSVKPKTASLLSFLKKYCASTNSFDLSVLDAFLRTVNVAGNPGLSTNIVTLWESYNGSIRKKLARYEVRGLYAEVDSLYNDLFLLSLLDVYDLLKWTKIKGILGDYNGAAQIFCEVSQYRKNFVSMARSQFTRLLAESDSSDFQSNALDIYKECYLSKPNADTLSLSNWLSRTYARFNLFNEENSAIIELDRDEKSRGGRLLATAQNRFSNRLFAEAIQPALQSWKYLSTEPQRHRCAIILYQSYSGIGKADSAILWLERVKLRNELSKVNAVVLYQEAGLFEKAIDIITTLKISISRDTLTIRQFLFEGKIENARSFIVKCSKDGLWQSARLDNFLWKIRTGVFSGMLDDAGLYIDSINSIGIPPSRHYAKEILIYRMALQRLGVNQQAFAYWGRLRYFAYIKKPQNMATGFNGGKWPLDIREYFAATLVEELITNKLYEKAQYVLDLVPELNESPQINYFRALTSFNLGYSDRAKKLFENIILSNPDGVFAHKARIYLLKLNEPQSM